MWFISIPACLRLLTAIAVSSCLLRHPAQADDCNRNGLDDLAEIGSGRSADCNQNGVPDDCDLRPVNPILDQSGEIPIQGGLGELPQMQSADLDTDGDLDLLLVFAGSDVEAPALQVIEDDGTGSSVPRSPIRLEASPESHALGDLDGDGDLDVAVTCTYDPPYGSIYFNEGDGTFPVSASLPIERPAPWITAADINVEGALDLCLRGHYGLSVLRNLGGGDFSRTDLLEDHEFYSLGRGDLDGDGDVDLVAMIESGGVALLNDGTGSLTLSPITQSFSQGAPVVEDLDGDGNLDLAFALRGEGVHRFSRGPPLRGSSTAAAPATRREACRTKLDKPPVFRKGRLTIRPTSPAPGPAQTRGVCIASIWKIRTCGFLLPVKKAARSWSGTAFAPIFANLAGAGGDGWLAPVG